jgi:ABC-type uncharacterized transport system involved in gliding motility auxiliary subunit
LEYDLSQLIYKLSHPKPTVVGVMSSLQINGGFDMASRQPTPPWMLMSQIDRTFEVRHIGPDAAEIDDEIDVLLLVHPKALSDASLYAIDQFVLRGGKAMIFVDPNAELDMPMGGMMGDPAASKASELTTLFTQWGVTLKEGMVLGDAKQALVVGMNGNRSPVRHLGLQGFQRDNFPGHDLVTDQLETINVASAGILAPREEATTEFVPLIQSSEQTMPLSSDLFAYLTDPRQLQEGFVPTGETYTVAARVFGPVRSAFPDGKPASKEETPEAHADKTDANEAAVDAAHVEAESDLNTGSDQPHLTASQQDIHVVIVADTDVLSDRLWVRVQDFFGQRVAAPWANNADFVINALEHLAGSSDLISIRSKGQFSRPFTRVQALQRLAEEKFYKKEQELNQRLQETEEKLLALQKPPEDGVLSLSEAQEQELVKFQEEKLKIRKQLRDVQHQLNKDIKSLGNTLKIVNIAVVPLVLTVLAIIFALMKRRRRVTL